MTSSSSSSKSSASAAATTTATSPHGKRLRLVVFDLDYTIWQPEMYQLYGKPRLVPMNNNDDDNDNDKKKNQQRRRPKQRGLSNADNIITQTRTIQDGMMITDGSGTPMRVFPGASHALADINRLKADGYDIQAAVASKTDEPSWAHFCMQHLAVPTTTISDVDNSTECDASLSSSSTNNNVKMIPMKDCFMVGKSKSLIEIAFDNKQYHFKQLKKKTGIEFSEMVFFDNEYGNIRSVSKLGVHCVYTPDGMQHKHWEDVKKEFGIQ